MAQANRKITTDNQSVASLAATWCELQRLRMQTEQEAPLDLIGDEQAKLEDAIIANGAYETRGDVMGLLEIAALEIEGEFTDEQNADGTQPFDRGENIRYNAICHALRLLKEQEDIDGAERAADAAFAATARRGLDALSKGVDWGSDNQRGEAMARALIEQMAADGFTPKLGHVVSAMIDGVFSGVEVGFFQVFADAAVRDLIDNRAADDAEQVNDMAGLSIMQLCKEWKVVGAKSLYDGSLIDANDDAALNEIYDAAYARQREIMDEIADRRGATVEECEEVMSIVNKVFREEHVAEDGDRATLNAVMRWLQDLSNGMKATTDKAA